MPKDTQKARERVRRYCQRHPDRVKARAKRWRKKNADYLREYQQRYVLAKQYGITPEEKQKRIADQGGKCAICGSADPGGKHGVFCTDHNHDSGQVRGELCVRCNKGMGFFDDNPEKLQLAAAYLEKWACPTAL